MSAMTLPPIAGRVCTRRLLSGLSRAPCSRRSAAAEARAEHRHDGASLRRRRGYQYRRPTLLDELRERLAGYVRLEMLEFRLVGGVDLVRAVGRERRAASSTPLPMTTLASGAPSASASSRPPTRAARAIQGVLRRRAPPRASRLHRTSSCRLQTVLIFREPSSFAYRGFQPLG